MTQTWRRSGPKVKTGCKTCKIRRIKCDETRPSCSKCTSTGRKCDGYTDQSGDFRVQVWNPRGRLSIQQSVPLQWVSSEGARYLEFYHHCAQPMLSDFFDQDFWSRTTLQMAYSEPAVRHALIALGYLHSTEDGSMKHARSNFASQQESGILLRNYNKSVRSLVDRMSEPSYRPEIGLVTCLLFVCIEFLRGNYHTGFTHLTSGLKLISSHVSSYRHDSPIMASSGELKPVRVTSQPYMSTLLEEELVPLFHRAMTSAMMYGVTVEEFGLIDRPDRTFYQQLRINNVRELGLSAHSLRNQSILHSFRLSRKLFFQLDWGFTEDDLLDQENLLVCQHAWFDAMMRFREERELTATEELVISAMLAHWYSINIWTKCVLTTNQMNFDDHLPAFTAILHHSRHLLDAMTNRPVFNTAKFSFEISVIPGLYFVAQRCRCPTTRREAVSLLERRPPREGLWDAQQHALVSKRLIEIEEEELDPATGWPVARTRLWSSVIDANMDQRGGFWAYFMRVEELHARKGLEKPKMISEFFSA